VTVAVNQADRPASGALTGLRLGGQVLRDGRFIPAGIAALRAPGAVAPEVHR
jgi:hypothetical protein